MQPILIRSSFDDHHPPQPELISDCVHCGFCLPSCPTYLLYAEEMDSPRGRIYLMSLAHEGEPITDRMVGHWDLCLGCLACVTACPSGVQYGRLIEETRQQIERVHPRDRWDSVFRSMIYALFPYPRRLRRLLPLLRLYQRPAVHRLMRQFGAIRSLPERLQSMEALLPPAPRIREPIPEWTRAAGDEKRRAALLQGCVQSAFFPHVNAATVRVLAADGYTVWTPALQGCCGALSMHGGRESEALAFARRTIDTFDRPDIDAIVSNVAGCGAAMKEFGDWFRDDPAYAGRAAAFSTRVRDLSEALDEVGPAAERHPIPLTAVYHDACHLLHGQGISEQPRMLLNQIPELKLVEVSGERNICCGSAGTFNLLEPEPARELGLRKARNVIESGAQLLIAANPGCLLQIKASLEALGQPMPAAHLVEVLDASIRGATAESVSKEQTWTPALISNT